MTFPKKVKVTRSISYTVKWVDRFGVYGVMGECDPVTKEIRLKKRMSKKNKVITFIHECIHAMEFEHGIPIKEKMVGQFDTAVYGLLKLNGWMPR